MRLYEYEGKALLARHGVPVPPGAVWPGLPEGNGPVVVKAQILGGGRARLGGIRFANDKNGCQREAQALLGARLGEHKVDIVYVEDRLEIEQELYLAVVADRQSRSPLLLATQRGGVDVTYAPDAEMLRMPIGPFLGLRPFAIRYVTTWLGLTGDVAREAFVAINGTYRAFETADALLVEINPLVVTRDCRVIAADAKVILDDTAAFRHPDWPRVPREGTAFERQCASLGIAGVEMDMDGEVAVVTSGAGLMMATIDLLSAGGVTVKAAVDLAGVAFASAAKISEVVRLVGSLSPKLIFFNAFLNLASCDQLALGIAEAFGGHDHGGRVIVRLRGRNLPEAKEILSSLSVPQFDDLPDAISAVVRRSREVNQFPS